MIAIGNTRRSTRTAKPNVASARNSPDKRMAGMATMAPTGTATRPASARATSHGTPAPWVRCENVVAPTAANVAWHSETWPDVTTRRRSDAKTRMKTRAAEYTGRRGPANEGTAASTARTTAAPTSRDRADVCGRWTTLRTVVDPNSTSQPRRANTRTAKSTMNGMAGGSPLSTWYVATYLVESDASRPTMRPPANVSGRLEKRPMA